MELDRLLSGVAPADAAAAETARARWEALLPPGERPGRLEEAVVRLAALQGGRVRLDKRLLLLFCADGEGSGCADTVRALAEGTSCVNRLAQHARCRLMPVDMGVRGLEHIKGMPSCRITGGPPMSRENCLGAIRAGAGLAMTQEADVLLLGALGHGGAALAEALLAQEADPVALLAQHGGAALAALCGACLGAALAGTPLILDGTAALAAASCAKRLCAPAGDWLLAAQAPENKTAARLQSALGLGASLNIGLGFGAGAGALATLELVDLALALWRSAGKE